MDINQNQQINTFLKGMNTDTSDMLLSSDLYRFARNVRVITNTDSNSGELRIVDGNTPINLSFLDKDGNPKTVTGEILAMDSIRDMLVLIVKENDPNNEILWSVYTHRNNTTSKILSCTDEKIWTSDPGKTISTVLRWESENNIKLYIADGIHELMCTQINKPTSHTHFKKLFTYNNIILPPARITVKNGGNIPAAMVQYAYRFYRENGGSTSMSPLTEGVSLYKDGAHGFASEKKSNKAVDITINNAELTSLDRVLIYRINYIQNGYEPEITMVADTALSVGDNVITDYGYSRSSKLSVAEFLSMYDTKIRPRLIESKGDYLFLANDSYSEDASNELFDGSDEDVRCFSLGNYYNTDTKVLNIQNGELTIHDVSTENLKHLAFTGSGSQPEWSIEHWGDINNTGYNGIGKYFAWKYVLKDWHEITPTNQTGFRSYRRGEIYRFGVRLFNSDGVASSVKWMCDILMPDMFGDGYDGIKVTDGTIQVRELGIQFDPINTSSNWWNDVYAYEIVLCKRTVEDYFVVTQGIAGKPLFGFNENDYRFLPVQNEVGDLLCPSGFFSMCDFQMECPTLYEDGHYYKTGMHFLTANNYFIFASPEYTYQPDDVKDLINANISSLKQKDVVSYFPQSSAYTGNWEATLVRDGGDAETVRALYLGSVKPVARTKSVHNMKSYYLGAARDHAGYYYNPAILIFNTSPYHVLRYKSPLPYIEGLLSQFDQVGSEEDLAADTTTFNAWLDEFNSADVTTDNAGAQTWHYFNYYIPDKIDSIYQTPNNNAKDIQKVAYAASPKYSDFGENGQITLGKNITAIDDKRFINWTNPGFVYAYFHESSEYKNAMTEVIKNTEEGFLPYVNDNDTGICAKSLWLYPIGAGGSCILFKSDGLGYYANDDRYAPPIHVKNIIKTAQPYGGYTRESIRNSTYLSVGGYHTKDEYALMYYGDVFIKIFTYNASREWYDSSLKRLVKNATVYAVPLETTIDIQAQSSLYLFNVDTHSRYVQDEVSQFGDYTQSENAYMYNTAYNIIPDCKTYYPDLTTKGLTNNFDVRVHFSERKINNEAIDNWLLYKASNFLDVDSRYGLITSMNLFKDRLMFWQEHAFGLLSVNERILINDMNDTQLQLGTGGVLERFDYVSLVYGMKKDQQSYAESDSALYWWDGNNKEILQYGQGLAPLSTLKQIKNYLNEGTESLLPTILYDDKYKEAICNVVNNESIAYNEQTLAFTSVYDENVQFWCNVLGKIYENERAIQSKTYLRNSNDGAVKFFENSEIKPYVKYVVNKDSTFVKTFDIQTFGGRFYGGEMENLANLQFDYRTPLKQHSSIRGGENITDKRRMTNLEYDYRLTIPRNGTDFDNKKDWGDRMRGKTMQCEIRSDSNSTDFSLQYVITKFRMSWT